MIYQVSIIGSGQVAFHLIELFKNNKNFELKQVCARQFNKVSGWINHTQWVAEINQLSEVDLLIVAVTDQALPAVAEQIILKNTLVVHTSGTQPMSVFSQHLNFGVFYPLQTFSQSKDIDFSKTPLCIEANNPHNLAFLEELANKISSKVQHVSSQQRKILHLCAVFVCNFVNHMYHIGASLSEKHQVPFELLMPLIEETTNKIKYLHPKEAQTGPAKRGDESTMQAHLELLDDELLKTIYKTISLAIRKNEL